MSLPLVTVKKLAEDTGYSPEALRAKVLRGEFVEGVHYCKSPDGRIHFYIEAYLQWVQSNVPRPKKKASKTLD